MATLLDSSPTAIVKAFNAQMKTGAEIPLASSVILRVQFCVCPVPAHTYKVSVKWIDYASDQACTEVGRSIKTGMLYLTAQTQGRLPFIIPGPKSALFTLSDNGKAVQSLSIAFYVGSRSVSPPAHPDDPKPDPGNPLQDAFNKAGQGLSDIIEKNFSPPQPEQQQGSTTRRGR